MGIRERVKIVAGYALQAAALIFIPPAILCMSIAQDRGKLPEQSVIGDILTFGPVGFLVRMLIIGIVGFFWIFLIGGLWIGGKKLRGLRLY